MNSIGYNLSGGTTLKYYEYLKQRKPLFDGKKINAPELIGLEPIYSMFINNHIHKLPDYLSLIGKLYEHDVIHIQNLLNRLYYDPERKAISQRDDMLIFLMESGQYINVCLEAYALFLQNVYVSYKDIQLRIANHKGSIDTIERIKSCFDVCKNVDYNMDTLRNHMNQIVNDKIMYAKSDLSDKPIILYQIVRDAKYLTSRERKSLSKKLTFRIDRFINHISTLMKEHLSHDVADSFKKDLKGKVNDNPHNLIVFIKTHTEDLKEKIFEDPSVETKYTILINALDLVHCDIIKSYNEYKNTISPKLQKIEEEYNDYVETHLNIYETHKSVFEMYGCDKFIKKDNEKHKVFTVPLDEIMKEVQKFVVEIELAFNATRRCANQFSPFLIFGILLSYYYRYLEMNKTDDNIHLYYNLIDKSLFEYSPKYTSNVLNYTVSVFNTFVRDVFDKSLEHMPSYAFIDDGSIELYSDIIKATIDANGTPFRFTSCGEITILNIMRLLKTIDISPKSDEYLKVLNIENTDEQITLLANLISNVDGIEYNRIENGFRFNLRPNELQVVRLLNRIYFDDQNATPNIKSFFDKFHVAMESIDLTHFKIKIKERNVNMRLATVHAGVEYASSVGQPIPFDFMTMWLINDKMTFRKIPKPTFVLINSMLFLNRQEEVLWNIKSRFSVADGIPVLAQLLNYMNSFPTVEKDFNPSVLVDVAFKLGEQDVIIRALRFLGDYKGEQYGRDLNIFRVFFESLETKNMELIELTQHFLLNYSDKYDEKKYHTVLESGIKTRVEMSTIKVFDLTTELIEKLGIETYDGNLLSTAYSSQCYEILDYALDYMLKSIMKNKMINDFPEIISKYVTSIVDKIEEVGQRQIVLLQKMMKLYIRYTYSGEIVTEPEYNNIVKHILDFNDPLLTVYIVFLSLKERIDRIDIIVEKDLVELFLKELYNLSPFSLEYIFNTLFSSKNTPIELISRLHEYVDDRFLNHLGKYPLSFHMFLEHDTTDALKSYIDLLKLIPNKYTNILVRISHFMRKRGVSDEIKSIITDFYVDKFTMK
jgi:hypothetical protein